MEDWQNYFLTVIFIADLLCKKDRKAPIRSLMIDTAFQNTFVFAYIQKSINLEVFHSIVIRYQANQSLIANFDPYVNRSFSHSCINTSYVELTSISNPF